MPKLSLKLPDLETALAALVAQIPRGRVATCGRLARALGDPIAARWVGSWLRRHDHDAGCTCHRVVRADGSLGGYIEAGAEQADPKSRRLREEGAPVVEGAVDLAKYGWTDWPASASAAPLERLREIQATWADGFASTGQPDPIDVAAGLDVSYVDQRRAVGSYALVELATRELLWSITIEREIRFPYISTYLAFRELPILWDLVEAALAASKAADVYLVDGSGVLHHRRGGVATCFGVSTGLATIGVTKTLLCGKPDRALLAPGQWTYVRGSAGADEPLGAAMRTTERSRKLIYISPGHRIDVPSAVRLAGELLAGRKLPEPIYWADRISRQAARAEQAARAANDQ